MSKDQDLQPLFTQKSEYCSECYYCCCAPASLLPLLEAGSVTATRTHTHTHHTHAHTHTHTHFSAPHQRWHVNCVKPCPIPAVLLFYGCAYLEIIFCLGALPGKNTANGANGAEGSHDKTDMTHKDLPDYVSSVLKALSKPPTLSQH